jgi:hypothetical protein
MLLEPVVEFCATPWQTIFFFARAFFSESRWARPCRSQLKPEMGRIISGLWSYCNRWKILRLLSSEKILRLYDFIIILLWWHQSLSDASYCNRFILSKRWWNCGHFWDGPWKVDKYLMCKNSGPVDGRFSSTKKVPSNGGWWMSGFLLWYFSYFQMTFIFSNDFHMLRCQPIHLNRDELVRNDWNFHFGSRMAQSPGVMIVSQESLLFLELDIPFIEVKPWR